MVNLFFHYLNTVIVIFNKNTNGQMHSAFDCTAHKTRLHYGLAIKGFIIEDFLPWAN